MKRSSVSSNKRAKRKSKTPPPREPRQASETVRETADESPASEANLDDRGSEQATGPEFPVVGIGASAGGLEAFSEILDGLGAHPEVALVFVAHLAPQHESALPALLGGRTRMPVVQVTQGTPIQPNHVYVIPPNAQMEIGDGHLYLNSRPDDRTQYTPIDFFFRSLAATVNSVVIGVVLSGSSSDGSAGLREIKAVGGITIAQDPTTARYDGMPRAAIATGSVDLVLKPVDIAKEIERIGRHPYAKPSRGERGTGEPLLREDQLRRLVSLLRNASGIDFTHYKPPTIRRRLQRRMVLLKMTDVAQYLRHLQTDSAEAQQLSQDILIHVTRFFRDPDSFQALGAEVFPDITASRSSDTPIRIWVPGCSTGEEAYSVAISVLEHLGEEAASIPVQIFATDVSEAAIDHARVGVYPQTIAADVSPERLRRFFSKSDGNYRITKVVRDLCVFARQDLTRDPPFSKLDLVVCRNVLIYLAPTLQRKLLNVFHYSLRPSGYLMLGHAETTGPYTDLFAIANKRHRIYRKKADGRNPTVAFPVDFATGRGQVAGRKPSEPRVSTSFQTAAQRVLLERFAPPGVVVDDELRIVQFIGHTGRYLEPAPGDANLTLPKMVRDGLLHGLRTAFQQARREGVATRRSGLHVRFNGHDIEVTLEVIPIGESTSRERHHLVLFQETAALEHKRTVGAGKGADKARNRSTDGRLLKLEEELAASRDYLQSIIQELEAANEELQSANEEILSSNEELQSTNEELDTAKEELQSTNEELNTVNEELHGRNEELSRSNSDLLNLISSVEVALVIVENDLRIRRFTPKAERLLNLISSDVGRPIGHIKPNIECPDLESLIHEAINSALLQEREVKDQHGRPLSMQIRPYKSVDNRIDGAVIALFDAEARKANDDAPATARDYEAIFQLVAEPLVEVNEEARIRRANRAFSKAFGVPEGQVEGKVLYEIGDGQWDAGAIQALVREVVSSNKPVEGRRINRGFSSNRLRAMLVSARRVTGRDAGRPLVLLAIGEDRPAEE
jgi:two-component system CheB/CheR fusion protein